MSVWRQVIHLCYAVNFIQSNKITAKYSIRMTGQTWLKVYQAFQLANINPNRATQLDSIGE
jgi:hypothetical protein